MKRDVMACIRQWIWVILAVSITPAMGLGAQPGIDLDGWGATTHTSNSSVPYSYMESWVKIIDHDGIADDGSSHTVTVTYPDNATHGLSFRYKANNHAAYYELTDRNISQPINVNRYSGRYRFRVVDPTGDWSEVYDDLVVNPIAPPVEANFLPNFSSVETLTAAFDDVYVNDLLWDDFESGFDPDKWYAPPSGVRYENGEVLLEKTYATPSGSLWFNLKDEPALTSFKATVRADAITGNSSRARIVSKFWNDGHKDISCRLKLHENTAKFVITKDHVIDGHMVFENIVGPELLGPITPGHRYDLTISWDGSSVTFQVTGLDDSVNYTATHTPQGTLSPATAPSARLGIVRHLTLADTALNLSWDPVPDAACYRIQIYAHDESWRRRTKFTGYTGNTTYNIPPGILKPNGYYAYRIDAVRDPLWLDNDNRSLSNPKLQFIIAGPSHAQDPSADLWNMGAETWTNNAYGGNTFTSYYLKVHDAQGVPDNIESVKVLLPDTTTEVSLYLDYNKTGTHAVYKAHYFGPLQAGEHLFTIVDKESNTYRVSETLTPDPIAPPEEASFSPPNNTVIGGTAVYFDWADVPAAALYQLVIYDKDLKEVDTFNTTESEFMLEPGILDENSNYRYRVYARGEFFEDNTDNGSGTPFTKYLALSFFTTPIIGTSAPTLNIESFGASVRKAPAPGTGDPVYALEFRAAVSDPDGAPENIQSVEVTYPDGSTKQVLNYLESSLFGSNYFQMDYYADPALIQEGPYQFRVVDFEGHETVVETDTLSNVAANALDWPTHMSPMDGAMLPDTAPVIAWDPVAEASYYRVGIYDRWVYGDVYWGGPVKATQFKVPAGILDPYTAYNYRVYAFREAAGSDIDFLSCSNAWQPLNNHFTTGEALEGLLAFARNFGRTDCSFACSGNSDADADIDGMDLVLFADTY